MDDKPTLLMLCWWHLLENFYHHFFIYLSLQLFFYSNQQLTEHRLPTDLQYCY